MSTTADAATPDTTIALASLRAGTDGSYTVARTAVGIPVSVRDAKLAAITYLVDAQAAQAVIAGSGLRVAPKGRGGRKAVVSLALVRYDDCDLGDYDELGLSFVVAPPAGEPPLPKGGVATYIHRLPVSQAFTCEAGRGIWGFPKWLADLRVTIGSTAAAASLRNDDGSTICAITARTGGIAVPSRPMTMVCYSNDEQGSLLRTEWRTDNISTRLRFGTSVADVTVGDGHPLAEDLRCLGLGHRRALMVMSATMRATFGAPAPVATSDQAMVQRRDLSRSNAT